MDAFRYCFPTPSPSLFFLFNWTCLLSALPIFDPHVSSICETHSKATKHTWEDGPYAIWGSWVCAEITQYVFIRISVFSRISSPPPPPPTKKKGARIAVKSNRSVLDWNVLLGCIACIRQCFLHYIYWEWRLVFNMFPALRTCLKCFVGQYRHVAFCWVVRGYHDINLLKINRMSLRIKWWKLISALSWINAPLEYMAPEKSKN